MKAKMNAALIVVALLTYCFGLCNASAFYDPGTQRWMNRDPFEEVGGKNLFTFTRNNSVNGRDAFGLSSECDAAMDELATAIQNAQIAPGPITDAALQLAISKALAACGGKLPEIPRPKPQRPPSVCPPPEESPYRNPPGYPPPRHQGWCLSHPAACGFLIGVGIGAGITAGCSLCPACCPAILAGAL
jgi:hypothetical protein